MNHSNQGDNAKRQTKLETKRDEARHASVTFFQGEQEECFFDDQPATLLLNGTYLCYSHAVCNTCLKPLTEEGLTCRCEKEGYVGHAELLWCSAQCLENSHPDPDYEQEKDLT